MDGLAGARPTVKDLTRQQRPEHTPLAAAVELAISLSQARLSSRTIVLSEDFWTGVLDIDERSIHGLEGEELVQMLRFEAESMSGWIR